MPSVAGATYSWLRRGFPVPGAAANTYTLGTQDYGSPPQAVITMPSPGNVSALPLTTLPTVGSAPVGAWGLAPLVSGYGGPLVRVQRTSDSTQMDIGAVAGGLDLVTATTFQGSGSLLVTLVYDQTGHGRNLFQSTTANMPQLVLNAPGGPIIDINTDTSAWYLQIPTSAQADRTNCSFFLVLQDCRQAETGMYFEMANAISGGTVDIALHGYISKFGVQPYSSYNDITGIADNSGAMLPTASNMFVGVTSSSGGCVVYRDYHSTTAPAITTAGTMTNGGYIGYWNGFGCLLSFQAMVMYPTALNGTDSASVHSTMSTVFGTNSQNPPYAISMMGDSKTKGADPSFTEIITRQLGFYLPPGSQFRNIGIGGNQLINDVASGVMSSIFFGESAAVHNVAIVYEGINDVLVGGTAGTGASALAMWTAMQTWVGLQRGFGFNRIIACTLTTRALSGTQEAQRQIFNSWIRSNYGGILDAYAEFEQIPGFLINGIDNVFYFPDYLHEDHAAYLLEAPVLANAVEAAISRPQVAGCIVSPVITGTLGVGNTLACSTGTWFNSPTGFTYQWNSNIGPISGATGNTYVQQTSDRGNVITCGVVATNAVGSWMQPILAQGIGVVP